MGLCECGQYYCGERGQGHDGADGAPIFLDMGESKNDDWISEVSEDESESEEEEAAAVEAPWVKSERRPGLGETDHQNTHGNFSKGIQGPKGEVLGVRHLGEQTKKDDAALKVKYITSRVARIKYQVYMGSTIKHRGPQERKGLPVDTGEIRQRYTTKYIDRGSNQPNSRRLGAFSAGGVPPAWTNKAIIWVCVLDSKKKDVRFYTHVCKVNRFHHSSFKAGRGVIGAGEWNIVQGKLKNISANSGHYKPDLSTFHGAVLKMEASFHRDTMVCMWDTQTNAWVDRPVQTFKTAPSGGGRYQVSPNS